MKNQTILGQIEPELLQKVISRRSALRRIGLATAATLSVPVALGLMTREAYGAFQPEEVKDVLNFALMLERLEYEFYVKGMRSCGLIPREYREIFRIIMKHEHLHVDALDAVLLGQKSKRPKFDYTAGGRFPDVFQNFQTFAAVSQSFEDTGVRAYKGQAANLMGHGEILSVALRIHSVEARHAAQVRMVRGAKPWITGSSRGNLPEFAQPVYDGEDNTQQGSVNLAGLPGVPASAVTEAFDEPLTKEAVLQIVQPFIVEM